MNRTMFNERVLKLLWDSLWPLLSKGLTVTIPLTLASFTLGLALAMVTAFVQVARVPVLRRIARFYIWVFRGTPMIVQLFIVFYGLPGLGLTLDAIPAAIVVFSLNTGAYAAETVRAAIESVPVGQFEAGYMVGMSYLQIMARVVLPQAMRTAFPPLFNTLIGLVKHGWSALSLFIGTNNPLSALIGLVKHGWSALPNFVGTSSPLAALIQLAKYGWSALSLFVGTNNPLAALIQLAKSGWSSLSHYVGTNNVLSAIIALARESNWKDGLLKWLTGSTSGKVGITLALSGVQSALKSAAAKLGISLATGGIITASGIVKQFASGGTIMNSGRASWWGGVQKYASGTSRAHGTLFVAGEAGPEIVGHVGGRTEVLNKSQLAQTMQSAVTIGMLTALRSITFRLPAVTTSAVPYEVAAQAATSAADMQATLDANNEDLIQTIISVIGAQTTAIVAALQAMERNGATGSPLTAQQVINEINRRTQMFSASPLKGV